MPKVIIAIAPENSLELPLEVHLSLSLSLFLPLFRQQQRFPADA